MLDAKTGKETNLPSLSKLSFIGDNKYSSTWNVKIGGMNYGVMVRSKQTNREILYR